MPGGAYQNVNAPVTAVVAVNPPPEGTAAIALSVKLSPAQFSLTNEIPLRTGASLSQVRTIEIDNSQNTQALLVIHGAALQATAIPPGGGAIIPTTSNLGPYRFNVSTPVAPAGDLAIGVTLYNYFVPPAIWSIGATQSGVWAVSVTNAQIPVSQFGAWSVGAAQDGAWSVGAAQDGVWTVGATQSGAWNVGVNNVAPAPAGFVTGQVSVGTGATLIAAARAGGVGVGRAEITLINDGSGATTIYLGDSGVTVANGLPLPKGTSLTLKTTAAIYGIVPSGTQAVGFTEVY